jgi:hypothetical protein
VYGLIRDAACRSNLSERFCKGNGRACRLAIRVKEDRIMRFRYDRVIILSVLVCEMTKAITTDVC